jgi:DNA repair protein RadC
MIRVNRYTIKLVKEKCSLYNIDKRLDTPERAYKAIEAVLKLSEKAVENFGMISLNGKNFINGIHILSVGTLSSSLVHPREVFKSALLNNAAQVILFHNHPSGDPEPSSEDVESNKRMMEAGILMGMKVVDHIVVGEDRYVSFKEKGLM